MKLKFAFSATMVGLSLMLCPRQALAHSVETDYQLIENALQIQANFSTGEVFENAKIVVYAPNEPTVPWFTGTTDASGQFVFRPDPAISGQWSIKIGEGSHSDELIIPVIDESININQVSYLDGHIPHRHTPVPGSFVVFAIALGTGMGAGFFRSSIKL